MKETAKSLRVKNECIIVVVRGAGQGQELHLLPLGLSRRGSTVTWGRTSQTKVGINTPTPSVVIRDMGVHSEEADLLSLHQLGWHK